MKILIVSPEMEPFAKTGGLADVAGALPKALKEQGHDVRVIIPKYKMTDAVACSQKLVASDLIINVGNEERTAQIFETKIPGTDIPVYLVGNADYFDRNGLYGEMGADYQDNAARFVFFSKAVLEFVKKISWEPHVIHCNDWQTGLVCAYIKTVYAGDPFFKSVATIYSVHNMGYLGMFPGNMMPLTGIGWDHFTPEGMEFWGHMSFAKAGLVFADVISTVSPSYANEIQTEEHGSGLDGLMKARSTDIYGILNGIDYDVWNPAKDKNISSKFSLKSLRGKSLNKTALRKALKLPSKKDTPVIGMVSRITEQKGFDILSDAFERIMGLNVQFVLLGVGDTELEEKFKYLSKKYPDKVSVNIGFSSAQAPLIYAGSDMFLMPSRYEPCGLGQLIAFKYGSVPVVRATGGLLDTVHEINDETGEGEGFVFSEYSGLALFEVVKRSVEHFKDKKEWNKTVKQNMAFDFSWEKAAEKYIWVYKKAIEKLKGKIGTKKAKSSKMGVAAFL